MGKAYVAAATVEVAADPRLLSGCTFRVSDVVLHDLELHVCSMEMNKAVLPYTL